MSDLRTILGLSSTDDRWSVERAYREKYSDLVSRIDQAPTPKLKVSFQQRLDELQRAWKIHQEVSMEFLPSAQPMAQPQDDHASQDHHEGWEQKMDSHGKRGRGQVLLFGWGLLSFALAVLFLILWIQNRGHLQTLSQEKEKMEKWEALFSNGVMEIKNRSTAPFILVAYELWYLDEDQNLQKRERAPANDQQFISVIEAGRSYTDTEYRDAKEVYGGQVLFYHLLLADMDGNPKSLAGFVHQKNGIDVDPQF